jgi:membrane-associated phospholipid phosphatase
VHGRSGQNQDNQPSAIAILARAQDGAGMGEQSTDIPGRIVARSARLLGPPFGLLIIAALAATNLKTPWVHVLAVYIVAAVGVTALCQIVLIYAQVIALARIKHPNLVQELAKRWARRSTLARLILASVVAPAFLAAFVVIKALSTRFIPYPWDGPLASLDRAIFGTDAWIPLHRELIGSWVPFFFEYTYVGWQILLPLSMAYVALKCELVTVIRFYTAMYLTWIVAGIVLAIAFHSGGPVYAYLFDPFEMPTSVKLHASLSHALPADSRILRVQTDLMSTLFKGSVTLGGGISAMPSMHVAVTAAYLCALWHRPFWRSLAGMFFLVIWVGSVYTGYHYATDGLVGAAVAALCWWLADTAPFRRNKLNVPARPANS